MYSWGDDTSTWKGGGSFKFDSARSPYLKSLASRAPTGPRSYTRGSTPDLDKVDPKRGIISTESENPIILAVDGTGSMQSWPGEIFDRLPLLCKTLYSWEPESEISIAVIGDSKNGERWPVQMSDFGKDVDLENKIQALAPEGQGGGGLHESYELFGHYVDTSVKTPKAKNPVLVMMGDENFYDSVSPTEVSTYLGLDLQDDRQSTSIWDSLKNRFDVFLLQKPYGYGDGSTTDDIKKKWADALGDQYVVPVDEPERIVDVTLGLFAKRWDKMDEFYDNINARQDSTAIKTVMHSLRSVPDADKTLKSVSAAGASVKKSKLI